MAFERALLRPGQLHQLGDADAADDAYSPRTYGAAARRSYAERPMPAEEAPAFFSRPAPSLYGRSVLQQQQPYSSSPSTEKSVEGAFRTQSAEDQQGGGSPGRPLFMTPPTRAMQAGKRLRHLWSSLLSLKTNLY
jgi:hypothetical protein